MILRRAIIPLLPAIALCAADPLPPAAEAVRAALRVPGGAAAVVGSRDGRLEAALATGGRWVVHGLARDAEACAAARAHLRSEGLYGIASVEVRADLRRLPYADHQLQLLVVAADPGPAAEEIRRCLAPGGIAYVQRDGRWSAESKERPAAMGEWTHPMGGPDQNPVSPDRLVAPTTTLRWIDGYGRFGYHMAQGAWPVIGSGVEIHEQRWQDPKSRRTEHRLVCRDAFSGVVRWQARVRNSVQWMVVAGDRLLSTHRPMDQGGPQAVHVYDLANGRRLGAIGAVPEIKERERQVAPMVVARDGMAWVAHGQTLTCYRLADLSERWTFTTAAVCVFSPALAADGSTLVVAECDRGYDFGRWPAAPLQAITALDPATGKVRWRCTEVAGTWTGFMPVAEGRILFYCPWGILAPLYERDRRTTTGRDVGCLDLATGRVLWRRPWDHPEGTGKMSVQVGLIRDGKAWAAMPDWLMAWDGASGARTDDIRTAVVNQRCVRTRATVDWFLMGFGTLLGKDGRYVDQNIARSGCAVGTTPAYGMLYNGSNGCGCFGQVRGVSAFAADPLPPAEPDGARLERGAGPAEARNGRPTVAAPPEMITIQNKDGGVVRTVTVPPLSQRPVLDAWVAQEDHPVGATEPVAIPEGELVAVVDEHRLECREGDRVRWSLTADARITAPPVVVGDTVVVGAADGWVYAVGRSDGVRRWRALVAPAHRRIVAYGQFESSWPVRRLAVHQGLVCAAAGRHPELDGGIWIAGLDPAGGARRWQGRIAADTAGRWLEVGRRGNGKGHQNTLTNGGFAVRDGQLVLVAHDGGGELVVDPARPPQ